MSKDLKDKILKAQNDITRLEVNIQTAEQALETIKGEFLDLGCDTSVTPPASFIKELQESIVEQEALFNQYMKELEELLQE